nr:MAG: RNA-dependent RNA polymerase [Riboviria sp.]
MEGTMKSLVRLSCTALREAGQQHQVPTDRDIQTLCQRVEAEGVSFLTITLPAFEKALTSAISDRCVGSNRFKGFALDPGGLPRFLGGFLRLIFDNDGCVRGNDRAVAGVYQSVRQFLLLLSKVELDCSEERINASLCGYVDTDAGIQSLDPELLTRFSDVASSIFSSYFSDLSNLIYSGDVLPRHSSGALATGETYNGRFAMQTWTERLDKVFPHWDYLQSSWRETFEFPTTILPPEGEPPVKVVTVPKTLKGPRIIAEEPAWMQYMQQGILRLMSETLRRPSHHALWARMCWDTQDFNREFARIASVDGAYSTIDLSEASDRVSYELARALFRDFPVLWEAIDACRSRTAKLPNGDVIALKKFASMGSSLCFPVETFVFHTIVTMGIRESGQAIRTRVLGENIESRVYGDDMIVPVGSTSTVVRLLESFGLKVNQSKSFSHGFFR